MASISKPGLSAPRPFGTPRPATSGNRAAVDVPELLDRWQKAGDREARDALVTRFLPLAKSLALRYRRSGVPVDDLIQVASLGLLKAINRFDTNRDTAFSSFALPTILGELKRHFRDTGWAVHVPRRSQERAMEIEQAESAIATRTGRSPTIREVAQYLELSYEQVLDGLHASRAYAAVPIDAPRSDQDGDDGGYAATLGAEDDRLKRADSRLTALAAIKQLPERERVIVELRFSGELTQTEIAARVGVSQMQVSRLLRQALATLHERTRETGAP